VQRFLQARAREQGEVDAFGVVVSAVARADAAEAELVGGGDGDDETEVVRATYGAPLTDEEREKLRVRLEEEAAAARESRRPGPGPGPGPRPGPGPGPGPRPPGPRPPRPPPPPPPFEYERLPCNSRFGGCASVCDVRPDLCWSPSPFPPTPVCRVSQAWSGMLVPTVETLRLLGDAYRQLPVLMTANTCRQPLLQYSAMLPDGTTAAVVSDGSALVNGSVVTVRGLGNLPFVYVSL